MADNQILFPPIVDAYMPAFLANSDYCRVYFSTSKFTSLSNNSSTLVSNGPYIHATVVNKILI